jgi:hypothetical protein
MTTSIYCFSRAIQRTKEATALIAQPRRSIKSSIKSIISRVLLDSPVP